MAPRHQPEDFAFLSRKYFASSTLKKEAAEPAAAFTINRASENDTISEDISPCLEAQPYTGDSFDDLSSDSNLSNAPDDIGPDPSTSSLPCPTLSSNSEYDNDLCKLKLLLAHTKQALLTTSSKSHAEKTAELSLFMSAMDIKWPGLALGGGRTLEQDSLSLNEDISSSDDGREEQHTCPYASTYGCAIIFHTSTAAIIHSTIHTTSSGSYLCPLSHLHRCNKNFSTLSGARQHGDAVHLGLKRFPCPYATEYDCPKSFSQSQSARVHGYTHTGERPYPCPYAEEYDCVKTFTQSHSAREHGYIHTGEKPYPCPYAEEYDCTRAFSQLHSAKDHGYTHLGEKPYACPHAEDSGCKRTFSQLHSAKEHGSTHTGW